MLIKRYVSGGASESAQTPPPVGSFVTEVLKHNEEDKPIGGLHHAVHLGERAWSILPNMSSSGRGSRAKWLRAWTVELAG